MSTSENSYFGKAILFVALSIVVFIIIKQFLPSRLFSEHVAANNNILVDSMMINAVNDTLEVDGLPTIVDTLNRFDPNFNPSLNVDGYRNLDRFYAKLHELEKDSTKSVRIAYFGDSMNDGDYIVQDVRSEFQENYGGEGVGYVAISSLSAGARGSVSHQYSKNWKSQSFVKVKKPTKPFGIDGQVFFANDPNQTYWVRYKAGGQQHSKQLNKPTLFYGRGAGDKAYINVHAGKDSVFTKNLNPSHLLNKLTLTSKNVQSLQVDFHHMDSIPVYGFNFDNGEGVHVDNFSIRGNSGLPLSILSPSLMNAFDRELGYDLIILHYGANVLGYGSLNFSWYERNMTTVVANLRECFPNADILVISTADKSTKIDQTMETDPAVLPLAKAQQNYARNTGSGFINLYEVMGGNGSMVKWVNDNLAGKDYTHFNASGSRRIAKLIYKEIDKGYTKYKDNL